MHALHANSMCSCLQTCEILKNTWEELQNTHVLTHLRAQGLNRAVPLLQL